MLGCGRQEDTTHVTGSTRNVSYITADPPRTYPDKHEKVCYASRRALTMSKGYTIRIYVPDGDPEGVKIIDQFNWTGKGLAFPRHKWQHIRQRAEFSGTGVYVLAGYGEDEDQLPKIYVGQGDLVGDRIEDHVKNKGFWNQAVIFVSNSGLNKAHAGWLEHALWDRAKEAKRCLLDNVQAPQQPALSEAERADTEAFFQEILRILPLVGVHAFEIPTHGAIHPSKAHPVGQAAGTDELDTVIVPAQDEGFKKVFLGQNCWYEIRISSERLDKIKYIAAYQTYPVSAITHFAPVHHIEPYGDAGKYKLVFSEAAKPLPSKIPFADAPQGAMQSIRYTTLKKLQTARKLTDIIGKALAGSN